MAFDQKKYSETVEREFHEDALQEARLLKTLPPLPRNEPLEDVIPEEELATCSCPAAHKVNKKQMSVTRVNGPNGLKEYNITQGNKGCYSAVSMLIARDQEALKTD